MQAILFGVRDAIARLDIAKCQEATRCARGEPDFGLGLIGPASGIHRAFASEASSDLSAFIVGAASRINISSSSVILAVMIAGIYSMACACFIICRANQKSSPGNHGYDRFYQALIRNSKLPIAILGKDMGGPISFGGGAEILLECLSGPDAAKVARALDTLLRKGVGFASVSRGVGGREIVMHGAPVGRSCAIYFSIGKLAKEGAAILDALDVADMRSVEKRLQRTAEAFALVVEQAPFAMAIFDGQQKLATYNRKYALLWGLSEDWLQSCPSKSEIIDRLRDERKLPERKDFQQWKHAQLQPPAGADMETKELWHLSGGKSLRIVTSAFSEGGQLSTFEDISEHLSLEASLNSLSQVQKATVDALEDAVAIFGPDGRLMLHNSSFEELLRLTPSELSTRPHCSDIARLCDARTGHDEIWQVVSDGISAMVPVATISIHEIRRENGQVISLTLSRLPEAMTMAVFSDFSDLNRFEAMLEEDRATGRDVNSRLPQTG